MNILHAAGFTIPKAQRELADWYVVAVKLSDNNPTIVVPSVGGFPVVTYGVGTYAVISPTLSLAEALLVQGQIGQVILKFPQGYDQAVVEYTQWGYRGVWKEDVTLVAGQNTFNTGGSPTLIGSHNLTLKTCGLVESGFFQYGGKPADINNAYIVIPDSVTLVDGYYYNVDKGWTNGAVAKATPVTVRFGASTFRVRLPGGAPSIVWHV